MEKKGREEEDEKENAFKWVVDIQQDRQDRQDKQEKQEKAKPDNDVKLKSGAKEESGVFFRAFLCTVCKIRPLEMCVLFCVCDMVHWPILTLCSDVIMYRFLFGWGGIIVIMLYLPCVQMDMGMDRGKTGLPLEATVLAIASVMMACSS